MSFDIFVQRFVDGDAGQVDVGALAALIEPLVSRQELEAGYVELSFPDGRADLYGVRDLSRGFMVNHVGGRAAWDFLVAAASTCGLTIMLGGLVVVADPSLLDDLPEGLADEVRVVASGAELVGLLGEAQGCPEQDSNLQPTD